MLKFLSQPHEIFITLEEYVNLQSAMCLKVCEPEALNSSDQTKQMRQKILGLVIYLLRKIIQYLMKL